MKTCRITILTIRQQFEDQQDKSDEIYGKKKKDFSALIFDTVIQNCVADVDRHCGQF